jgi:glycosyltransferase involved in cell wall biosynthesis
VRTGRKLLFVTPFPPRLDADHGGGRAVAQLVFHLAERNLVAIVALRADDERPVDEVLQARCEFVEEVPRRLIGRSPRRAWVERARVLRVLSGGSGWPAGTTVAGFATRVSEVARSWRPDVVQFEFLVMAQYLRALDGTAAARVVVEHDPSSRSRHARLARRVWRRLLLAAAKGADAVVVFTESDLEVVRSFSAEAHIVRIPLAVELPNEPLDPAGSSPTVLFFGSFAHRPNVKAALRLVQSIFPRVLELHPAARLRLVGAKAPECLRRAADANVVVTGSVPDLAPYLNDAAVVAAPLSEGGGMRLKVLETLAAGKALVASPVAVEGLPSGPGDHFVLASSDGEFAAEIAALLNDPARRVSIARTARRWARENLDLNKVVSSYEALYESVAKPTSSDRSTAEFRH